ncbi:MAG: hypothetical protein JWM44_3346 [Bacilli bacterium]|nr:hypothetical protein [Bacilli bacterium]
MVAINSTNALNSYQNYNSFFSLAKTPKNSDSSNKLTFSSYASALFAKTAATGLAAILNSANQLNSTVASLRNVGTSSLLSNRISSSDPFSIKAVATKETNLPSTKISVQSLAAAQKNSGASFAAFSPTTFQSGKQQFSITMGNKTTQISFFSNNTDIYKTSLSKMRDAINASDSGVSAKLVTNPITSRIHLDITGNEPGTNHSFSLADTNGNAVGATKSNSVTASASDAAYRLDGGTQLTSSTNEIKLDHGNITVTLLKTTSQDVTLSPKPDANAIVKQTKQLVDDYNTLHAAITDQSGYLNSNVKKNLESALNSYALDTLGISKKSDGTLSLNENKLKDSIQTNFDQVSQSLGGFNGIATKLSKATERLQASPSEALLNVNNSEYKRYSNYQFNQQFYSQLPTSGLLLNRFF